VKNSKLQMLTSRFKDLKMGDDEMFNEFYARLNDIENSTLNLRGKIDNNKVVKKS
jgi:hypothetical protein